MYLFCRSYHGHYSIYTPIKSNVPLSPDDCEKFMLSMVPHAGRAEETELSDLIQGAAKEGIKIERITHQDFKDNNKYYTHDLQILPKFYETFEKRYNITSNY